MTYAELYPLYPVFAFIGFVIVLIPLPWHLQSWNSGTCLFMIWTALACLNNFVNSIVWHGNVVDWAPVWCDISTRFAVGANVAIPAASLCINRRLYVIARCKSVGVTKAEKRRTIMIDCAIGIGIPLSQMVLQYIVQAHRYTILEDIGCFPNTFNTPLAYLLTYLWPNTIALLSAYYCILCLREFNRRRAQFASILKSCSTPNPFSPSSPTAPAFTPALSPSRYFRLMALATLQLTFNTPVAAYSVYKLLTNKQMQPWISFSATHAHFSEVDRLNSAVWRADTGREVTVELGRWTDVWCAFVFFAFFGFAEEARRWYVLAFGRVRRRFGMEKVRLPWGSSSGKGSQKEEATPVLPVYLPPSPGKGKHYPHSHSHSFGSSLPAYEKTLLATPESSTTQLPLHDIELGVHTPSPTPSPMPSTPTSANFLLSQSKA
ncbi:pheromone A receptor-domain-containing protein [Roridomyces roridus]|uniref:Pheromone A receptor-domain-containing protein n=1 Tax=Roridomyces roridus TaxID=1738132 RepID=A0AAD7BJB8_9AGAR|nr:pheromone A receptor-domain-containing protein [Roridomyces roridus]